LLIIHADDLGMSHSVNRATFEALEEGWVTSASMLVPGPWFAEVANWARGHPDADLGVHLALTSEWANLRWGPLAGKGSVPSLVDSDGYLPRDEVAVLKHARVAEVEIELRAQLARAKTAGLDVSHLDSHMGILLRSPAFFRTYRRLGEDYRLPCVCERRDEAELAGGQSSSKIVQRGIVDGVIWMAPGTPSADWARAYEALLSVLPSGLYELIVHLGHADDELRGMTEGRRAWGAQWRQSDFDLVRSERFRDFLARRRFVLTNWHEVTDS
jgi:predicted glycoside hydrolase/deacetylase ChbG (UPF0249 family)